MDNDERIIKCLDWILYILKYYRTNELLFEPIDIGLINMLLINNDNKVIANKLNNLCDYVMIMYEKKLEGFKDFFEKYNANLFYKAIDPDKFNIEFDPYTFFLMSVIIYDVLIIQTIQKKFDDRYKKYLEFYNTNKDFINSIFSLEEIDYFINNKEMSFQSYFLIYGGLKYIWSLFVNINVDEYEYFLDKINELDFSSYININNTQELKVFSSVLIQIILCDTFHGCLKPRNKRMELYKKCIVFLDNVSEKIKILEYDLYLEFLLCKMIINPDEIIDFNLIYNLQQLNDKTNMLYYGSFNNKLLKAPKQSDCIHNELYCYTRVSQISLLILNFKTPGKLNKLIQ
jgi:hypothetical protein